MLSWKTFLRISHSTNSIRDINSIIFLIIVVLTNCIFSSWRDYMTWNDPATNQLCLVPQTYPPEKTIASWVCFHITIYSHVYLVMLLISKNWKVLYTLPGKLLYSFTVKNAKNFICILPFKNFNHRSIMKCVFCVSIIWISHLILYSPLTFPSMILSINFVLWLSFSYWINSYCLNDCI